MPISTGGASGESKTLDHVIPHVGPTQIRLYRPADRLYEYLRKTREVSRLRTLRHVGALDRALPGARHARWDYTAALAYYAEHLNVPGMKSSFTLGGVSFSSAQAALQTIALCWNIGHLPGVFPVEKGVCRFLHERNKNNPAEGLAWPHHGDPEVQRIRKEANRFLIEEDYLGIARVLAAIKLLSSGAADTGELHDLIYRFAVPFLLSYDEGESRQWRKLRVAFNLVRHLAYLTLDTVLAGLQWCPSVPSLVRDLLGREGMSLEDLSDGIAEILSPVERMTYSRLYHREAARRETAVVADWVHDRLEHCSNPSLRISHWMKRGLFRDLRLGRRPAQKLMALAGSIRLRTHFADLPGSPAETESLLRRKNFPLPLVLKYRAWNSEAMIEPDELIIDAGVTGPASPDDVGRLLVWMMQEFETRDADPHDTLELLRKQEFELSYVSLLRRAVQLSFPDIGVVLDPWPLARFGLLPEMPPMGPRGALWACDAGLSDSIVRHIVRNRRRAVPAELRDRYAELMGVRELRDYLRAEWNGTVRRQRCLVVTASIRFRGRRRDLIEFDGGIVTIASRSGRITWYGLESKRGAGDPLASLQRRLTHLGISARTHKLSSRYAFAELTL